jgi:hypothetical protein
LDSYRALIAFAATLAPALWAFDLDWLLIAAYVPTLFVAAITAKQTLPNHRRDSQSFFSSPLIF